MTTVTGSPSQSSLPFQSLRLPIERPASDIETLQELQSCSAKTLRRTRERHRRALNTLRDGGYEGLSVSTRQRLIDRLERDLTLLNRALGSFSDTTADTLPNRLWAFVNSLW